MLKLMLFTVLLAGCATVPRPPAAPPRCLVDAPPAALDLGVYGIEVVKGVDAEGNPMLGDDGSPLVQVTTSNKRLHDFMGKCNPDGSQCGYIGKVRNWMAAAWQRCGGGR